MRCEKCNKKTDILQAVVKLKNGKIKTGGFIDNIPIYDHPKKEYWCKTCIHKNDALTTSDILEKHQQKRRNKHESL